MPKLNPKSYKIAEFSKLVGVSVSLLKLWDGQGKLIAMKTEKGHRFYVPADLEKAIEIRDKVNVTDYTATQFAKLADLSLDTLYAWDKAGLLVPDKKTSGHRIYHTADLDTVKRLKDEGYGVGGFGLKTRLVKDSDQ